MVLKALIACVAVGCVSGITISARAADLAAVPGVVSHIKLLSDKCEDVSSLEDWKKTYIKEGMSDQDKALAIWKTVVRYRHQTNPSSEWRCPDTHVHDPLKTIHVYGYGMCCCATSNVTGLARYLGMEARGLSITSHTISEIKYDNTWHMVDGSLMNYFLKPNGVIASADEIRDAVVGWHEANPGYKGDGGKLLQFAANGNWRTKGPALLATYPYAQENGANPANVHGWHATMCEYDYKQAVGYETMPSLGYELNIQLREGERITRNWSNQKKVIDWTDADIVDGGQAILGVQRKLGDKAPGRIGNGLVEYDVPLATVAFRRGALTAENLACTAEDKVAPAVHVMAPDKSGVLIIRMPSSYVYLGGTVSFNAVVGTGGAIVVSYSDNNGMDWEKLTTVNSSGTQKLDLGNRVVRKYDYRIKLEMQGKGTGLDVLKITNEIQHSQAPLPTLADGKNVITLSAGAQEGTITIEPNTDPDNTRGRQLSVKEFHPTLTSAKLTTLRPEGKGSATFSVPTPGDITRVRVNMGYRCRDANDTFVVSSSFDGGKTFVEMGKISGPTVGYTKYMVLSDVPAGSRNVLVKMEGKELNTACVFALRIDADYKEPAGGFRPVKITYTWDENGQAKTDEHICSKPSDSYEITCGPKTTVKSVAMELAPL